MERARADVCHQRRGGARKSHNRWLAAVLKKALYNPTDKIRLAGTPRSGNQNVDS
jgi:hypothetical protein